MKKNIIIILLLICLLAIQISFLNNFNLFFLKFNLIIIALILLLNMLSFSKVIALGVMCGFIADIFSGMPFGTYLITYAATIFIIELAFMNFFTNSSFYSLIILGVIGVVAFNIFFLAVAGVFYFLNLADFAVSGGFWLNMLLQIIDSSIVLAICFYLINNRTRLFKPVFLRS